MSHRETFAGICHVVTKRLKPARTNDGLNLKCYFFSISVTSQLSSAKCLLLDKKWTNQVGSKLFRFVWNRLICDFGPLNSIMIIQEARERSFGTSLVSVEPVIDFDQKVK